MTEFLSSNPVMALATLQVAGTFLFITTFVGVLRLSGKVQ